MEDISIKRGYLTGILITLGLLVVGYAIDPVVGTLKMMQLTWPQNLFFIMLISAIGLAIGVISDSEAIKRLTGSQTLVPMGIVLTMLGVTLLVNPHGFDVSFLDKLFSTPIMLLATVTSLLGGAYIGRSCRSFKSHWSGCLLVLAVLVFAFSTIVGQHDFYNLSMRIGTDRALFEAEGENGLYYRLPFAVKLLPGEVSEDGINKVSEATMIRFFDTVSEYEDVVMGTENDYRLKGWVVKLVDKETLGEDAKEFVDLNLVFDRWIELKYISLGLLLLSLIIKLKF